MPRKAARAERLDDRIDLHASEAASLAGISGAGSSTAALKGAAVRCGGRLSPS